MIQNASCSMLSSQSWKRTNKFPVLNTSAAVGVASGNCINECRRGHCWIANAELEVEVEQHTMIYYASGRRLSSSGPVRMESPMTHQLECKTIPEL